MPNMYPRFFTHTKGYSSDALFVRFDNPDEICKVITKTGERPPNIPINFVEQPSLFGRYLSLPFVEGMIKEGEAVEITEQQAKELLENA